MFCFPLSNVFLHWNNFSYTNYFVLPYFINIFSPLFYSSYSFLLPMYRGRPAVRDSNKFYSNGLNNSFGNSKAKLALTSPGTSQHTVWAGYNSITKHSCAAITPNNKAPMIHKIPPGVHNIFQMNKWMEEHNGMRWIAWTWSCKSVIHQP